MLCGADLAIQPGIELCADAAHCTGRCQQHEMVLTRCLFRPVMHAQTLP